MNPQRNIQNRIKFSNFAAAMLRCSGFIYKIVCIWIISLCLFSCAPKPELGWVPDIESVSALVTDNNCVLTAVASVDLAEGYSCGFLYGKNEDNMLQVQATVEGRKFNCILELLDYDSEYLYKAYVSNGRNEIFSSSGHFRTSAEASEEYSMILPFHTKEVGRFASRFTFEVGGNTDFSVTVPEDVDWLRCGTNGRTCIVFIETNNTKHPRSCEIVFRNLSDDKEDTLVVYQQAADASQTNLPYSEVILPPTEIHTWMTLLMDQNISVTPLDDDSADAGWLSCGSVTNIPYGYSEVFFRTEENTADHDRTAGFIVSYDGYDSVITVKQKAHNAIIEFEDPFVEIVLVDAFDQDGDGKLSYKEVAQITIADAEKIDFSGLDIRAFEELNHFSELWYLQHPSFAGTRIERIQFPYMLSGIGDGLFENCTELKEIELNCISVGNHAFRGCTGLKNIRGEVSGEKAFEGCTALETVEQQYPGVADQAFMDCTSLNSFEFRIKLMQDSRIGYEAFRGCVSLPEISIPDVVGEIADRAFYNCSSLAAVYMERFDPPVLGNDVFAGTSPDLKIYVRPESLSKYQAAWPLMADRIIAADLEGEDADKIILPFHYLSLEPWETEFTIEVGGTAEFEVEISTLNSLPIITYQRDGRKCTVSFEENSTLFDQRWSVIFRNRSNDQCEILTVSHKSISENQENLSFNTMDIPSLLSY